MATDNDASDQNRLMLQSKLLIDELLGFEGSIYPSGFVAKMSKS